MGLSNLWIIVRLRPVSCAFIYLVLKAPRASSLPSAKRNAGPRKVYGRDDATVQVFTQDVIERNPAGGRSIITPAWQSTNTACREGSRAVWQLNSARR